jgi:hypothetical protein
MKDKVVLHKRLSYSNNYPCLIKSLLITFLKEPFRYLKEFSRKRGLSLFLSKLEDKRKTSLEMAFINLRNETDESKKLKAAMEIQKKYSIFKERKSIMDLLNKVKKIRDLLFRMSNRDRSYMFATLKHWKRLAYMNRIENNAKIIQKFLNEKVKPKIKDKNISARSSLMNMFVRKLKNSITLNLKDISSLAKFMKFKQLFRKCILKKFRINLLNRLKHEKLTHIINIHYGERARNFWLKSWNDKTNRIVNSENRMNNINYTISLVVEKINEKLRDYVRLYFLKWIRKTGLLKMESSAITIQNFVRDKFQNTIIRSKWRRFADQLEIKNAKLNRNELFRRLRIKKGIEGLEKNVTVGIQKAMWREFCRLTHHNQIISMARIIFKNYEKRNQIILQAFIFKKWRTQIYKLKKKELGCSKIFKCLSLRNALISAEILGSAFKLKKLLRFIRLVLLKDVFIQLQLRRKNIIILKNNLLVFDKCDDYLHQENKQAFVNKIFKFLIFKKILKMINTLDKFSNIKVKNDRMEEFFDKLKTQHNSNIQYTSSTSGTFNKDETKKGQEFSFKRSTVNPKKVQSVKIKRSPYIYVIPHLFKRLEKLQRDNNKYVFNSLKIYVFSKLVNNYNKRNSIAPLIKNLKNNYEYLQSIPKTKEGLKTLLHKYFAKLVYDKLKDISKVFQLAYLFKLSLMHKDIAKKHFIREVIRLWKFAAFMRKVSKKKMEAMYKTMQTSYLTMANEVFGDDEHGLIKEFEVFGNSIGMFTNEDLTTYEETKKKFYNKVQKRYVFKEDDAPSND